MTAERCDLATGARPPRLGELARGWAGAVAGYLIGSYGSGLMLNAMLRANRPDLVEVWLWSPWILGAVLCGVGAGLAAPAVPRRSWWTWIVAAAPIPVGASLILLGVFAGTDLGYGAVMRDTLVQVVIAAAVATAIGVLRGRARSRDAAGVR